MVHPLDDHDAPAGGRARRMMPRLVLLVVVLLATACGGDAADGAAEAAAFVPTEAADDCLLRLHGKGGDGAAPRVDDGVLVISPRGNADGWDAFEWDYRTEDGFADARGIVLNALNRAQCQRVVVHGFSNGAAMAAALACDPGFRGGPVVGYVIDDPVTDDGPVGCAPDPAAEVALYWTGALPSLAPPGSSCDDVDWTCLGDTVRSIDDYARDLGVDWQPSIHDDHRWYDDPPEIAAWLS